MEEKKDKKTKKRVPKRGGGMMDQKRVMKRLKYSKSTVLEANDEKVTKQ